MCNCIAWQRQRKTVNDCYSVDSCAYGKKLVAAPLKQTCHDGAFHLTESHNRFQSFAYAFATPQYFMQVA